MSFFDDLEEELSTERNLTPRKVCAIICARWGGDQVYIPKKAEKIEVKPTDTVKDLIARGTPKRTAYNWVSRWKR